MEVNIQLFFTYRRYENNKPNREMLLKQTNSNCVYKLFIRIQGICHIKCYFCTQPQFTFGDN